MPAVAAASGAAYHLRMPQPLKSITAPKGFAAAGGAFGIKASGKPDLCLIVADAPCRAAAVFTTNQLSG